MGMQDETLIAAALAGNVDDVKAAIVAGADVCTNDNYVLRWAARYGHAEIVNLLLAAGADVNISHGYALRHAAMNRHTEVVRILLIADANMVISWSTASEPYRTRIIAAIDDCADVMTPAQRVAIAKQSKHAIKTHAAIASTQKYQKLSR